MELKPLNKNAIASAMEKANHYRLLNDPENAESICRDILEHDPDHQQALATLVLSLSDQLTKSISTAKDARSVAAKLQDEYARSYHTGIICERTARAILARNNPGSSYNAYDLFREAMENFEQAESLSNDNNDDAILRFNSCVRTIEQQNLTPRPEEHLEPYGDS